MKKILLCVIAHVILVSFGVMASENDLHYDFEYGGLKYKITDETEHLVKVVNSNPLSSEFDKESGYSYEEEPFRTFEGEIIERLVIPEYAEHDGTKYRVSAIGYGAFANCWISYLEIMGYDITVCAGAFYHAGGAGYVRGTFNKINYIGTGAFSGCDVRALADSCISEYIGAYAFEDCFGVYRLSLYGDFMTIEPKAFYGCPNIGHIWICARSMPKMKDAFDKIVYDKAYVDLWGLPESSMSQPDWNLFKEYIMGSGIDAAENDYGISFDGATVRSAGCEITLYHITGRKVSSSFESLSVEGVAPGVYIAVAGAETKKITVR